MGSKTNYKSKSSKTRTSTNKQIVSVKHAAKKRHHRWSRDRSERVRDALNRDADILYDALKDSSMAPSSIPQPDSESVVLLTETMQGLGR